MDSGRIQIQIGGEYIVATGISDTGSVRSENQDAIYLDKDGHFVLLADGMGGHERGAEASRVVIDILREYLQPEKIRSELKDITSVEDVQPEIICLSSLVDKGVNKANSVIYKRNKELGLDRYMGSTLVGLVPVPENSILWFHVGDSRLYRWRDSRLSRLTNDHSAYSDWVKKGKTGLEPAKNIVTRAVGPKEGVIPDIKWEEFLTNDTYILCSDGLNDMLTDEEISDILMQSNDVDVMATGLVEAAIAEGGKDNTSVIVCRT